jgi:hypothetical protein
MRGAVSTRAGDRAAEPAPPAPARAFPHAAAISKSFGLPFAAVAIRDPDLRGGQGQVDAEGVARFATEPSLEMAGHEAAHIVQRRHARRRGSVEEAERQAVEIAARVVRGLSAKILLDPGRLIDAGDGPLGFVPAGATPATHTVQPGETLQDVSLAVYGRRDYAAAIRMANPRVRVSSNVGGIIRVPDGTVLTLPDRPDPADPWANPYISTLLRTGGIWSEANAIAAVTAFGAATTAQQTLMVRRYLPFGNLQTMLASLPTLSTQATGAHERASRALLQHIQREATRADVAAQGLSGMDEMARVQADFMHQRNVQAASAASGGAPPTASQVAAQQAAQVSANTIAPQTAVMTPAQETALDTDLNTVQIPAFVAWATANHPNLGIATAHFRAAAREIFDRGDGIVAMADSARGRPRVAVGEAFQQMVTANPAYALSTVVHELWGHNTFEGVGRYGDRGSSVGLDLYDQSARHMPGYRRPRGDGRMSEIDNYGYHETEIYSLLREVPFYTPNDPAHTHLDSMNYDPGPAIQDRLQMIASSFEPRAARAIARGLYVRIFNDPLITASAMAAYQDGVRAVFSAGDAAAILA